MDGVRLHLETHRFGEMPRSLFCAALAGCWRRKEKVTARENAAVKCMKGCKSMKKQWEIPSTFIFKNVTIIFMKNREKSQLFDGES